MSERMQPLSGTGGQGVAETGPLVHLHFAPSRMLWRIGPAWAVVAGAVAAGAPLGNAAGLLRLATAVILADLFWGILRRIIPGFAGMKELHSGGRRLCPTDAAMRHWRESCRWSPQANTLQRPRGWAGWRPGAHRGAEPPAGRACAVDFRGGPGLIFLTRALFGVALAPPSVWLFWMSGSRGCWAQRWSGRMWMARRSSGSCRSGCWRQPSPFCSGVCIAPVFGRPASGWPLLGSGSAPGRPHRAAPTVGCCSGWRCCSHRRPGGWRGAARLKWPWPAAFPGGGRRCLRLPSLCADGGGVRMPCGF